MSDARNIVDPEEALKYLATSSKANPVDVYATVMNGPGIVLVTFYQGAPDEPVVMEVSTEDSPDAPMKGVVSRKALEGLHASLTNILSKLMGSGKS